MSFFFVLPSKIPFRITKSPETKNFITRLWIHSISSIAKAAFLWGFNYFFFFLSPKKPKKLRRKIFLPDLRNGERPSYFSLLFRGNRMFFSLDLSNFQSEVLLGSLQQFHIRNYGIPSFFNTFLHDTSIHHGSRHHPQKRTNFS